MATSAEDLKRWVQQRRLAEAREQAESFDAAPEPARALARGFALIAFVAELNKGAMPSAELSSEDRDAYARWAAASTCALGSDLSAPRDLASSVAPRRLRPRASPR